MQPFEVIQVFLQVTRVGDLLQREPGHLVARIPEDIAIVLVHPQETPCHRLNLGHPNGSLFKDRPEKRLAIHSGDGSDAGAGLFRWWVDLCCLFFH